MAADALAGKTLYLYGATGVVACASCHGTDVSKNVYKILSGTSATKITSAINSNAGGMGIYKTVLSSTDISNIAAYIANPTVAGTVVASVTPSSLAFASTTVGSTAAAQSVTLSSTGTAALSLSSMALSGTHASSFSVNSSGTTCVAGGSIAAGSSCQVSLLFTPAAAGSLSGSLVFTHGAGTSSVSLSGTGVAVPVPTLALSATSLDLGTSVVGTAAAARTVTVSNSGQAALNFSSLTLSGTNASVFSNSGTCAVGAPVAAGGSCTVVIGFTPTTVGALSASLVLASNASNGSQTLALTGTGAAVPAPLAAISPSVLAFGNVTVNSGALTRTVTLSNTGTAVMTLSSVGVSGATAFSLAASTCGNTLAAGASCSLTVAYAPTAVATDSATLSVASDGSSAPLSVALSGAGVVALVAVPTISDTGAISFADTATGQTSATHVTTLGNTGNTAYTISSLALSGSNMVDFRLAGSCAVGASVAAAANCTVITSFAPVEPGSPLTATVTVGTSTGASFSFALSGNAIAAGAPALSLAASALDQGSVIVGQTSSLLRTAISNTGTQEATVSSIASSSAVFSVLNATTTGTSGDCAAVPFVLLPGGSCNIVTTAAPTAAGAASATLTVSGQGPLLTDGSRVALSAGATLSVTGTAAPSSGGGGGCVSSVDGRDASLPILLLGALCVAAWRRSLRRRGEL